MSGPPAELRTRLVQAAYEAAIAEGRYEAPQTRRAPARARLYRDGKLTLLAPFFDYALYAFENPGFESTGLDELEHYNFFGWRRLRNPNAWFDTAYYLASNPDVRAAGDDPFWHYVFKGRAEGRAPQRPLGPERKILDSLVPPQAQVPDAPAAEAQRLGADALGLRLEAALGGAAGLALSFAAERSDAGAAQTIREAEERDYLQRGFVYLSASPLRAGAMLKALPAPWSQTRLKLSGETLGVAMDAEIAKALASLRQALPAERVLILHGVAGASVDGLMAIEAALDPGRRLFWLHDYASLCTGFRLMRNEVAYCGAPPPDSPACGICVHGEARRAQLGAMERLFQRRRFAVLAPSARALTLWQGATTLAHESAAVAEPARLAEIAEPFEPADPAPIGVEGRPLRVAFLGPPSLAQGWLAFERVLEACGELVGFAFHHFADPSELRPSRRLFSVETAQDLRARLIERRIHLVVMATAWPQPFDFAALDALAAGCDLLTLHCSGHAAELVEAQRRGRAFAGDDEILEFFVSGKAIAYARERERFPRFLGDVVRERPSGAT